MIAWYPLIALLVVCLACAYLRVGLRAWTIAGFVAVIGVGLFAGSHWQAIAITAHRFGNPDPAFHTLAAELTGSAS